jgi:group I intron endonuclease
MQVYIYGLKCPISNDIRYIGQSVNPNKRFKQHILRAKIDKKPIKTHKENWILYLINKGLEKEIKIEIIEICNENNCDEREIYWIKEYRNKINDMLTNTAEGGKCVRICGSRNHNYGKHMSEEDKKKLSINRLGDKNPMFNKHFKMSQSVKDKTSISLLNSTKLKESRQSIEYKTKISNFFSIPLLVIDVETDEIVFEFKNSTEASEFFECTKGNIKAAVRNKRLIGKRIKKLKGKKYKIIRKRDYIQ